MSRLDQGELFVLLGWDLQGASLCLGCPGCFLKEPELT